MMTHVLALHKAMLGGHLREEFWYYWHMLADATPVRKPRGPASTMQHYFALLGGDFDMHSCQLTCPGV
eukprot:1254982-Amphidinium_carterae.1